MFLLATTQTKMAESPATVDDDKDVDIDPLNDYTDEQLFHHVEETM